MATGFMAERKAAESLPQEDVAQEATTDTVRGAAGLMFWIGAVGCFTPLSPIGAVMAVVGGIVWLLAPANSGATQAMVDETAATGDGCGAFLWAAGGIFVIMGLALVAALVVGIAMTGGL